MAKYYRLHRKQELEISIEEAWDFFSSPKNLKKITPTYLGFEVTSDNPEKMYPGMIITYIVKPLLGIPLKWMTEITQVRENEFFIDEQRVGPYKLWHHQHLFSKSPSGGVIMEDIIHYILPLGILGRIAHGLFVRKQLEGIFTYRKEVTDELWGSKRADDVHKVLSN